MTYQFDFAALLPYWELFLEGVWLTIKLSAIATLLGFVGGALCAIARADGPPWLQRIVGAYVEVIRNTPLLVQIFLVYFGIAVLGVRIDANVAAVLALVVNVIAYTCEIMRAGIESIHKAQIEAADCLGLNRRQTYWHVILRPAIERVYPALPPPSPRRSRPRS
jgi:polar amino acid transport system permease protein